MEWDTLIRLAAAVVVGLMAGPFLVAAIRLLNASPVEYEGNRRRVGTLRKAVKGELSTERNGIRDSGTSAGLGVKIVKNKETGQVERYWIKKGQLSAESIEALRR